MYYYRAVEHKLENHICHIWFAFRSHHYIIGSSSCQTTASFIRLIDNRPFFYTKRETFIIIVIFMAIISVKELGFWVKIVQIPGSYTWLNIKTMNKNEVYLFFISQDGTQQRHTRPTTTKTFEISISFYCDICIKHLTSWKWAKNMLKIDFWTVFGSSVWVKTKSHKNPELQVW